MQRLMTRAWVEIDLGALVRNGERFARAAGVPLLPMVKADGYGLGAARVARALLPLDPWGFGVATVEEGEELRRAGIERPILVFSPLLPTQFDAARRARLRPVLADRVAIERWADSDDPWHLAIDTGMNRAGVSWREIHTVRDLVAAHPPEGACTHFHSSQLPNDSREEQERRFSEAVAKLPFEPKLLHADNSAAIEHRAPSPFHLARPGIFLYGVSSGHDATIEPEPVVAVRGRIVEVRVVQPGDTVGYDASWTASRAGRIATVSLGYADGYRRGLGNRAQVLVKGERVPVVGFVTMDMTMIDVTDKRCVPGDIVTLIGRDGDAQLSVEEVAQAGEFSPYEILTGLRGRLPRFYLGGERGEEGEGGERGKGGEGGERGKGGEGGKGGQGGEGGEGGVEG
jgi:alanine racemase